VVAVVVQPLPWLTVVLVDLAVALELREEQVALQQQGKDLKVVTVRLVLLVLMALAAEAEQVR
jgi:hypothetical protein